MAHSHKLIIRTTGGRPGSLKRNVRIAFTLDIKPGQNYGPDYSPVAFASMTFSSEAEGDREFGWDKELGFATYVVKERNGKKQCVMGNDHSPVVPPGTKSEIVSTEDHGWGPAIQHSYPHYPTLSFGGTDHTAAHHSISLVKDITCQGLTTSTPIIAWQPTNFVVGSSGTLSLQAYIVDDAVSNGAILDANDLERPLFVEPLACDALPDSSAWTLSEDRDGTIQLKKTDLMEALIHRRINESLSQGTGALARSLGEMKTMLDTLVGSLEDTQQRLLIVEESVNTNQAELSLLKTSLAAAREETSRLGNTPPEIINIVTSFDRTEEHLARVENSIVNTREEFKALAGARSDLSRLEALVHRTEQRVSAMDASLITVVDHRIPAIETKADGADESLGHIQDQLSAARTTSSTTRDRVDRLNRGVLAVQATVDSLGASSGKDEDRLDIVEESMGCVLQRLDAVEKRAMSTPEGTESPPVVEVTSFRFPTPVHRASAVTSGSLVTIRHQLAALDRRVPAMEARVDRMERSMVILERKVPSTDQKVARLEQLLDNTRDEISLLKISLDATKDELGGLGPRVVDVEMKMENLAEPLNLTQEHTPGEFPSRSHLGGTPSL